MSVQRVDTSKPQDPVTDEEISRLLADYETGHDVEGYEACGWRVWPFLKTWLAADIYMARNYPGKVFGHLSNASGHESGGGILRGLAFRAQLLLEYARWTLGTLRGEAPRLSQSSDILILGSGERYQLLGGKWVHYPTGPLADLLEQRGLRCTIWQWGEAPFPAKRPSANVTPALRAALMLTNVVERFRAAPPVPGWFAEFSSFYMSQTGRQLKWNDLAKSLSSISAMSGILERWLRRSRPGLLMVDNWYNGVTLAAAVAAHRLRIPVMDLQHGIQEQSHSAYHGWLKEPPDGWEARPGMFWVWGEKAESLLHQTNKIRQLVLRGGNPWIRQWLSKADPDTQAACAGVRKLTEGYSRAVLVTLACPISLSLEAIKAVIRKSPPDWIWLVRGHPRESVNCHDLEEEFSPPAGARVLVHNATDWPLYALLTSLDVHVSIDSTCANEALAFGMPTILISEQGANYFRSFVEAGVMFHARTPDDFCATAERALQADRMHLKRTGQEIFSADDRDLEAALDSVAQIARSRGGVQ